MQAAPIRPRFERLVDATAEATLARIEARIETGGRIRGWVTAPYAELRMPPEQRILWSPRLAIHAEDTVGGTRLWCRVQPEPDVWTAYLALWAVVGAIAIGCSMYGISQWVVGTTPWPLLIGLPIASVLGGLLYVGAIVGQRRGAGQTWLLQHELDAALEDLVARPPDEPREDRPRAPGFGVAPR